MGFLPKFRNARMTDNGGNVTLDLPNVPVYRIGKREVMLDLYEIETDFAGVFCDYVLDHGGVYFDEGPLANREKTK